MVWPGRTLFEGLFVAALLVHPLARAEVDPASQPETQPAEAASSEPTLQVIGEAESQPASAVRPQPQTKPAAAQTRDKTVRWSGTRDRVYKVFVSAGGLIGGACLPCLGCAGTAFVGSPELTMFSFALAPQLGVVLGSTAVALFFGDPVRALSAGLVAVLVGGAVSAAGFGALMLLSNAVGNLAVQGAAGYAWVATPLLASALTLTAFHVAFLWLLDRTPLQALFARRMAADEEGPSEPDTKALPVER